MKKKETDRHIRLILTRLKKLQNIDGSWANNNFINALVANSLSEMGAPDAMQKKSADFILAQKSPKWTWNYYSTEKRGVAAQKYPDDLDDTFCSLIAIEKIDPSAIDETAFNHIAKLLLNAENKIGGPYFTWIGKIWDDIDPVVNANISCFAAMKGIKIPEVTKYIDRCIGRKSLGSKYYHNPFLAYYFIAKNYRGTKRNLLIQKIRQLLKKSEISLANNALAACSLLHLFESTESVRPTMKKITAHIDSNAKTKPEALYIEGIRHGKTCYAQSEAFTLAACGEAISLYEKKKGLEIEEKIFQKIKSDAERRCGAMPRALRAEASKTLKWALEKDSRKIITLLPYRIVIYSLCKMNPIEISVFCGLASLYGWMAYSIYDSIIDEKQTTKLLPVANVFHREMNLLFQKIAGKNTELARLCEKTLDDMDCAQLYEVSNVSKKMPSEKQTIEKSIGFAIPSILALANAGIPVTGLTMKKFIRFFRHYIFVKQMSDDIRDWQDDVKNEIATRVTARLMNSDKSQFMEKAFIPSTKEIIQHCRMAKNTLKSSGLFPRNNFLLSLIDEYEETAKTFITVNNLKKHK